MNTPNPLKSRFSSLCNDVLRWSGYEIKARALLPQCNLLGLRNLQPQTVLDIGANEGQFAQEFRKFFPQAAIYSFEPLPACYSVLEKMSAGDNRWKCFNLAVGDEFRKADFYLHENHPSSSSFLAGTERGEELYPETAVQRIVQVDCVTLDSWIQANPDALRPPVLLKMDVQGYEAKVLTGAKRTLSQIDAVITEIIVQSLYQGQATFAEQVMLLDESHFQFCGVIRHAFDEHQNVISLDAVFRKSV